MMGAGGEGAALGGQGVVSNPTRHNKLERNRYLKVTPQCRQLPVALSLVVDQAHLEEVLYALANSPLRIQTTQVDFRHVRGIKPASAEGGPPGGDGAGPPPKFPREGAFDGRVGGPPPEGGAEGAPRNEDDPNLIQLEVYGIAAVYQRPPPKTKPNEASPGAPAGAPGR
jgi:hypothetical protein